MRQHFEQYLKKTLVAGFMLFVGVWPLIVMDGFAQTSSAKTSTDYPAAGHTYQIEFGTMAFKNEYDPDRKHMTFTRISDGRTGTGEYTAVRVRRNLFWNSWVESDGTSVARVEDFDRGIVHAIVHFQNGKVLNLSGTLKKLK